MQVKNAAARRSWFRVAEKSEDPVFALAMLSLAERWAEYMEPRLAAGETIADIAIETLRAAAPGTDALDPRKPAGDLVVDYLEECWSHGTQLRRWYGASRFRKQ